MSESVHLDTETIMPESFLESRKYRLTCRCLRCGKPYSKVVSVVPEKDPPCPRKACKAAALEEEVERRAKNMAAILKSQQAPGHIGANNTVKAVDETAKIVMQDYHLTDLKDSVRAGESVAPKLPPVQQAQADNFFGGGNMRRKMSQKQLDLLGRKAIAGAYRHMAVNPSVALTGHSPGEPALRPVRVETVNNPRR